VLRNRSAAGGDDAGLAGASRMAAPSGRAAALGSNLSAADGLDPPGARCAALPADPAPPAQEGNHEDRDLCTGVYVLPRCTTEAMSLHLAEIAQAVAPGAHAVLLLDQAGWHVSRKLKVPANIRVALARARNRGPERATGLHHSPGEARSLGAWRTSWSPAWNQTCAPLKTPNESAFMPLGITSSEGARRAHVRVPEAGDLLQPERGSGGD
jgi:hypothetical protein